MSTKLEALGRFISLLRELQSASEEDRQCSWTGAVGRAFWERGGPEAVLIRSIAQAASHSSCTVKEQQ